MSHKPLELLCRHIPDRYQRLVRYVGWYGSEARLPPRSSHSSRPSRSAGTASSTASLRAPSHACATTETSTAPNLAARRTPVCPECFHSVMRLPEYARFAVASLPATFVLPGSGSQTDLEHLLFSRLKMRHIHQISLTGRLRSISRAAEFLHVSQPVHSKAIRKVEKILACRCSSARPGYSSAMPVDLMILPA